MKTEYFFIIMSGILSGGVVFGGQIFANLGISSYEISILPSLFSIILLLPFILANKQYKLSKNNTILLIIYGIIASILSITQYGCVILGVPVSVAVLLLYTQPLWTILFSSFLLKEKISKYRIASVVIVLIGIVVLVNPLEIKFGKSLIGIIVALVGGVSLSGWIICGRIAGKNKIKPITTKFGYTLFMIIFLLVTYPLVALFVKEPSIVSFSFNHSLEMWLYLLIFELLVGLINQLFYLKGVEKVAAADAGILLLLEPLSASILAWIFLNQVITANIIVGGLFILAANYITIKEK